MPTKQSGMRHLLNKSTVNNNNDIDAFSSFTDFRGTLKLICDKNDVAGKFNFTPIGSTPDILYFGVCFFFFIIIL